MPEREEGRGGGVDVLGRVSVARRRPPRVQVVVIEGHLADDAREGHGQFAAGVDVAEQDVGDRVPPLSPGEPGLEDRGYVLRDPADGERSAVDQYDDGRRPRGVDRLDQLLPAGRSDPARCAS